MVCGVIALIVLFEPLMTVRMKGAMPSTPLSTTSQARRRRRQGKRDRPWIQKHGLGVGEDHRNRSQ